MNLLALWGKTPLGRSIEPGIRRTASGWQVYLRRDGEFLSAHFPKDAALVDLRRWREQQIGRRMARLEPLPKDGRTFHADVTNYLSLVEGLVTYRNRAGWMQAWLKALGDVPRTTVTAYDVRKVLDKWRRQGLSPATLNLRLAALRHMWTTLDGHSVPNPIKDVQTAPDPFKGWELPTWDEAVKAIDAITIPRTQRRLRLFLWTGWPPSQLQRIRPERVNLDGAWIAMPGRRKGKGTRDVTLPLLPKAVEALRDFLEHEDYKATGWHNSTLGRGLYAGCDRAQVRRFHVYALRHVFGTMLATIVKDDRVVSTFMQHASIQMTRRYTEQSVEPRMRDALALVSEAMK
jgi:integrase